MPRMTVQVDSERRRVRSARLGFRVDNRTRKLVEHAAALERRSLTDFCLNVLLDATRETIQKHETLVLSDRDRKIFFDALVHPPTPNARLRRAFRDAERRTVS